jgi:hypothetical protein
MMEKHEIWAVWIAGGCLITPWLAVSLTLSMSDVLQERYLWSQVLETGVGQSARLIVAAWLFVAARRNGNSPWVWSAAGLAFSVTGAVLYFVVRATEQRSSVPSHGSSQEPV